MGSAVVGDKVVLRCDAISSTTYDDRDSGDGLHLDVLTPAVPVLTIEDRADSAELAFEMVLGAYVALVHIHEAAFPGQYLALSPTMREFLADKLRRVEITMAEGRMTAQAFEDAVQRLHTAMQNLEDDLRALAPTQGVNK